MKPHFKNADDRSELLAWALSAPVGSTHEMKICKARRKYLHRLIDSGEVEQSCGAILTHSSFGSGLDRPLLLRVQSRTHAPRTAGQPIHTPVAGAKRPADAPFSEAPSSKRPLSSAGSRVGGSSKAAQSHPREMAMLAAEKRAREAAASSTQPPPTARSTWSRAPAEVVQLSDDDDDDDDDEWVIPLRS